jgi:hypothetical protein
LVVNGGQCLLGDVARHGLAFEFNVGQRDLGGADAEDGPVGEEVRLEAQLIIFFYCLK